MILKKVSKTNSSINNKNNIRSLNERSVGSGTQAIASITPLYYTDPLHRDYPWFQRG